MALLVGLAGLAALALAYCLYNGILWFNAPSPERFPVRGIDVSHHQGAIDWERISQQNIRFAFIKATEGADFKDPLFSVNWEKAKNTPLRVGAYHFFRAEKSGAEQAHNFIVTVPLEAKALPPVLDVECPVAPDAATREKIRQNIAECLNILETHYRVKPIIYATAEAYTAYLQKDFEDYPLWIRSIFASPHIPAGRNWTLWQYSNRGKLPGYTGREKFIDLNVFNGSEAEFSQFALPEAIK